MARAAIGFALLGFIAYRVSHRTIAYPAHPEPLEAAQRYACTVDYVVDGDTLDCREGRRRVRLLLIDAPEIEQGSFGIEATEQLASLAPPGSVLQLELDREPRDEYGRVLAYAWLRDGRMVNEELVRLGYAITFTLQPNVKYRRRIRAAQQSAKAHNAGLWAVHGFACAPVAFRHGRCG